uniref:Ubiquitin-like protease family profile domain-containing protein n=1 Tax=Aegilops tauschii subsp. strangulata TaxID=200361 RepID=A0A453HVD2_AEGTS
DQNKAQPGGVVAAPKVVETGAFGEKVGVEAEQGAGQSTSVAKRSRAAALQQGESSNHSHGKDCVDQEEVIHQGGKVTPKDACNMDPSGASDKVETPVLSQGTVQAMMVTSLEWEDGPSCSLFAEGTEDYEWMNQKVDIPVKHVHIPNASSSDVQNSIPSVPNFDNTPQVEKPSVEDIGTFDTAPKLPRANDIPGPMFDVSPISFKNASSDGPQVVVDLHETTEANVAVRGESNSLGKQSKKKRVAVSPDNVPTMKKIKVDAHGDALHHQYVMTRYKTRKPKKNELLPDFIEIDGFHISLENFHASLTPRAEIDNEVMTLYLKTFNYDQSVKKKKPKKFVFSVLMSLKLSAEPDVFDPKVCEKEFKNACLQNHISKSDLLFFMVVHKSTGQ